jgi:hypothetical protein
MVTAAEIICEYIAKAFGLRAVVLESKGLYHYIGGGTFKMSAKYVEVEEIVQIVVVDCATVAFLTRANGRFRSTLNLLEPDFLESLGAILHQMIPCENWKRAFRDRETEILTGHGESHARKTG